jgi:hypothetical protein
MHTDKINVVLEGRIIVASSLPTLSKSWLFPASD